MNYRDEVAVVRRLTTQIEKLDADSETRKWQRAEHVAKLCETKSQRQVAADTGLANGTIASAVLIWRKYGDAPARERSTYAEADYEVRGRGPGFGSSANTLPEKLGHGDKVALTKKLLAEPDVARDALREVPLRNAVRAAADQAHEEDVDQRGVRSTVSNAHRSVGQISSARYAVARAVDSLVETTLSGLYLKQVKRDLDAIRSAIDIAESHLAGEQGDWDSELAALLEGGTR